LTQSLLALRSFVFALLLPAIVVGWVPVRLFERHAVYRDGSYDLHEIVALIVAGVGGLVYVQCAWLFAVKGRGTVMPFDGPRKLVQRGPYRWVRNPMYLSLCAILAAEAAYFESWHIAVYFLCLCCAAHLIVALHDEPELSFRFGALYEDYKRTANRWLPKPPRPREPEPLNPER